LTADCESEPLAEVTYHALTVTPPAAQAGNDAPCGDQSSGRHTAAGLRLAPARLVAGQLGAVTA